MKRTAPLHTHPEALYKIKLSGEGLVVPAVGVIAQESLYLRLLFILFFNLIQFFIYLTPLRWFGLSILGWAGIRGQGRGKVFRAER